MQPAIKVINLVYQKEYIIKKQDGNYSVGKI